MSNQTGPPSPPKSPPVSSSTLDCQWIDRGTYWLSMVPQGSQLWRLIHFSRLSAGNFGSAVGHNPFKDRESYANYLTGLDKEVHTEEAKVRMAYGLRMEGTARKWYERKTGYRVREVGAAVPKWDTGLAASVDGEVLVNPQDTVGQGLLEIKCVEKLPNPIRQHLERLATGWTPPKYYHQHIWDSYYDQIQGGLIITERAWCDFVVYCENENTVFSCRVERNPDYWNEFLYPQLSQFWVELVIPRREQARKQGIISHTRIDPPGEDDPHCQYQAGEVHVTESN